MNISIDRVLPEQKNVLANLFEYYTYEFEPYLEDIKFNQNGLYQYRNVDIFLNNPNYDPYWIYVDTQIAGFVIVKKSIEKNYTISTIDQFFVTKKYCGKGVGKAIAKQIFSQYPGRWRVQQVERNYPAQAFWRNVIKEYTHDYYIERYNYGREPVQEFISGPNPLILPVSQEITLKLLENQDAEALFSLMDGSRNYLRRWLSWIDYNVTVNDTKGFIRESLRQYLDLSGLVMGVWFKGELVGSVAFNLIDWMSNSCIIGYWLGESFQGKGIMTKSCCTLIDYAFSVLNLNRVEIRVVPENNRSGAIPKRLGFQLEGCIREAQWLYDHFVDHDVYGILAKDWMNK